MECLIRMKIVHFTDEGKGIKSLRKALSERRPDIVHIHGCWSVVAWRASKLCRKHRIPYVLSPQRGLEPWHVSDMFWLHKLPMLIVFQRRMVRRAKAICAVTEQEKSNLLTAGLFPWRKSKKPLNENVVAISRFTQDIKEKEDRLYRKVADTYPFLYMDSQEIKAENILLRIGLTCGDACHPATAGGGNGSESPSSMEVNAKFALTEEELGTVRNITDESWRKIQLHANDEGVLEDVRRGAAALRLSAREIIRTEDVERFPRYTRKNSSPLKTDTAMMMPLRLEEVSDEEKASANDTLVCTLTVNLRHEMLHRTVAKRHLADFYTALRQTDFDEERVARMLKRLNLLMFTRRIMQILADSFSLQEGFMPLPPLNDGGTAKIRTCLYKADIQ